MMPQGPLALRDVAGGLAGLNDDGELVGPIILTPMSESTLAQTVLSDGEVVLTTTGRLVRGDGETAGGHQVGEPNCWLVIYDGDFFDQSISLGTTYGLIEIFNDGSVYGGQARLTLPPESGELAIVASGLGDDGSGRAKMTFKHISRITKLSSSSDIWDAPELSVIGCGNLTEIDPSFCDAEEAEITGCGKLTKLHLTGIIAGTTNLSLASLTLSDVEALDDVSVRYESFDAAALEALYGDLPDRSDRTAGAIDVRNNTGAATADHTIATAKNWVVTSS